MRRGLSYYQARAIEHLNKNFNPVELKGKAVNLGFKGQNFAKSFHEAENLQNRSNQYMNLANKVERVRNAIRESVTKSDLFNIMKSNKELFKPASGNDYKFVVELHRELTGY